jgi:hypothetical protein
MCWSERVATADRTRGRFDEVRSFIGEVYGHDLHTKRIDSLAGATLGVMTAASLAVAMIGHALAQARGLVTKHAVKQVDRLLSNDGINVWDSFIHWVPHQIGAHQEILVAMDWTEFSHDDQATLVLSQVTGHGRAAPFCGSAFGRTNSRTSATPTRIPACSVCRTLCRPAAVSPFWLIVASATRSCSPFSTNSASDT